MLRVVRVKVQDIVFTIVLHWVQCNMTRIHTWILIMYNKYHNINLMVVIQAEIIEGFHFRYLPFVVYSYVYGITNCGIISHRSWVFFVTCNYSAALKRCSIFYLRSPMMLKSKFVHAYFWNTNPIMLCH